MKTIVFFLALAMSVSIFGCSTKGWVKSKVLGLYFPANNSTEKRVIALPYDKHNHPVFHFEAEGEYATAYMYEYNHASNLIKKVVVILHRDTKKKNWYDPYYIRIEYTDYDDEGVFLKNRVFKKINNSDLDEYVRKIEKLLKAAQ
jgi:hypothetical protein